MGINSPNWGKHDIIKLNGYELDVNYFFNKRFTLGIKYNAITGDWNNTVYSPNVSIYSNPFSNGDRIQMNCVYDISKEDNMRNLDLNLVYLFD